MTPRICIYTSHSTIMHLLLSDIHLDTGDGAPLSAISYNHHPGKVADQRNQLLKVSDSLYHSMYLSVILIAI